MASLREILDPFDPSLPLERAKTIPRTWYLDPQIAELERRAVFGDSWQVVGRVPQLDEPGTYLTAEIAGEPTLVVRDEDTLRAFYNVCRHRAALVMTEGTGTASRLRCRYHGWTYNLAGQLRGIPEFDGVADFCREEHGLVPLAVGTAGPNIWVHTGSAPTALSETLAPYLERTANSGLDTLHFVERREYDLACNWKVFVDNYLDGGYHIPSVHPGLGNILDYGAYHNLINGITSVQLAPLTPPDSAMGKTVASVRTGEQAQYWWIYPNFMVNISDGVMDTNLVLPTGPQRCKVIFDFYFADVDSPTANKFIDESIAVSEAIQQEDIAICEEVQRGLQSRSFDTGRFSVKREGPGYHFHQLLGQRLQDAVKQPEDTPQLPRTCENP